MATVAAPNYNILMGKFKNEAPRNRVLGSKRNSKMFIRTQTFRKQGRHFTTWWLQACSNPDCGRTDRRPRRRSKVRLFQELVNGQIIGRHPKATQMRRTRDKLILTRTAEFAFCSPLGCKCRPVGGGYRCPRLAPWPLTSQDLVRFGTTTKSHKLHDILKIRGKTSWFLPRGPKAANIDVGQTLAELIHKGLNRGKYPHQ